MRILRWNGSRLDIHMVYKKMKHICFIYTSEIEHYMYEYITSISKLFQSKVVYWHTYIDTGEDTLVFIQKQPDKLTDSQLNRSYLLNTEQLTVQCGLQQILDASMYMPIIDYSQANIDILLQNNVNPARVFYLPYIPNDDEIYTYDKVYNACTIGGYPMTYRRRAIKSDSIDVLYGWKDKRDSKLFRYKILVNIHAYDDRKIFEEIRCNRCILNKVIVISERSNSDNTYPYKDHMIECDYEDIPKTVNEVLQNYDFYYNKLFANLDIEKIKLQYESLITVPFYRRIPKLFHHIWVGPKKIPDKAVKFINHIKELHPDYTFRMWTDEDLIPDNFTNLEQIHKADKYAQKADIMRYEILYRHGGIYLDTDFQILQNITPLLTHDLVVCNEDYNHDYYLTNAFIASSKGNLNLKRCVDAIPYCHLNGEHGEGVNVETGPIYFKKHVTYDNSVRLLPTHVMYPVHFNQRNDPFPAFSNETYGVHHWDHSWA